MPVAFAPRGGSPAAVPNAAILPAPATPEQPRAWSATFRPEWVDRAPVAGDPGVVKAAEAKIEAGFRDGSWESIAVNPNVLRLDATRWALLPRDQRESIAALVSSYLAAKGQGDALEVRGEAWLGDERPLAAFHTKAGLVDIPPPPLPTGNP